jgi:hypothetical protein
MPKVRKRQAKPQRDSARRALAAFKTPDQVRDDYEAGRSTLSMEAALFFFVTLVDFARPLPADLKRRVSPWLAEDYRRRLELAAVAMTFEQRHGVQWTPRG